MASVAEILERFRRTGGPPGAAAPPGVPRDLKAEVSSELRDVFGMLDQIEAEAAAITGEAGKEADRIRSAARLEAQRVIAEAQALVAAVRNEAEATRRKQRDREIGALLEAARGQAAHIQARAAVRIPGLIERIISGLLEDVARPEEADVQLMGRR